MKTIEVASGLLVNESGLTLMALRPPDVMRPSLWEYPGGKVEPNETRSGAVVRELGEELGIEASNPVLISEAHFVWDAVVNVYLYTVRWSGTPANLASTDLTWVHPEHAMKHLPCAPSFYVWYQDVIRYVNWIRK